MYRNSHILKMDITKGTFVLPSAIKTPWDIIKMLNPITEYV